MAMVCGWLTFDPEVTTIGCVPVGTVEGTCTFTWPGLMYSTYASCPPTVTTVPSSEVGALLPVKSPVVHARESVARLEP